MTSVYWPLYLFLHRGLGVLAQSLPEPNSNSYISNCFKQSPNKYIFSHFKSACFACPTKLHPVYATYRKRQTLWLQRPQMAATLCSSPTQRLPVLLLSNILQTQKCPLQFPCPLEMACPLPLLGGDSTPTVFGIWKVPFQRESQNSFANLSAPLSLESGRSLQRKFPEPSCKPFHVLPSKAYKILLYSGCDFPLINPDKLTTVLYWNLGQRLRSESFNKYQVWNLLLLCQDRREGKEAFGCIYFTPSPQGI